MGTAALHASWERLVARIDSLLLRASSSLNGMPRPGFVLLTVGLSLGLSLLLFSPRLCNLRVPTPGSYEWARADTYLAQCAQPFALAAEPAMRWRILPPMVAHLLGLPGYWPLAIPWAGLVLFVGALASSLERLTADRLVACLAVVLFCTSGPVLFVTMCNGINDGWWMLGLTVVCSSRSSWAVAVACLLSPWVDERFLLGLPLALCCRHVVLGSAFPRGWRSIASIGAAALVYPAVRVVSLMAHADGGSVDFVRNALVGLPHYLPNTYFGWWNGYRAGWILVGAFFWYVFSAYGPGTLYTTLAAALAGWASVTILASDLTRSTSLLLPAFAGGAWAIGRSFGALRASRLLLGLAAANLAMPFEMVIYDKSLLLHTFPFELIRLVKNWR
jgi:hypothetical protein